MLKGRLSGQRTICAAGCGGRGAVGRVPPGGRGVPPKKSKGWRRPHERDRETHLHRRRGAGVPPGAAARQDRGRRDQADGHRSATCSLAYSPGVAVPVRAIADNPDLAYDYTSKGNLVAVITNGTAILGLGDLGALAAKPVMEGKAVLFKRFADVDSIDVEIATRDPDEIITVVKNIGAHLRRHQSGGHQEPRVLPHRDRAAGAARHPGVPRRPARHGDHLGGRADQRLPHHRPQAVGHQAGAERRRRGRHRLARPDQGDGRAAENCIAVDSKGVIYRGRTECDEPVEVGPRGGDRARAPWPTP